MTTYCHKAARSFQRKFTLILAGSLTCCSLAQADESMATTGTELSKLSAQAREVADLSGVSPVLAKLESEQRIPLLSEETVATLSRKQKILYLREKLNSMVQSANLQIHSTRSDIDSAIAKADEVRAYITEQENRLTHRNSQINLLSGGVTKIVGYSLALSPITDIPTNVLEVFDGSVQATLSALALRLQRKEAKLEQGMPAVLEAIITENSSSYRYPRCVWMYLNRPADGSAGKSRRQQLIDTWRTTGLLTRPKQTTLKSKQKLAVELLDQRKAMLSDLKSVVSAMHHGLMELGEAIVVSYQSDPIF